MFDTDQNIKVFTGRKQAGNPQPRSLAPWIHGSEPISPLKHSKKSFPTSPTSPVSPFDHSPPASQPSKKSIGSNPLKLCEETPHVRSRKQFEDSSTRLWVPRDHRTLVDAIESSRDHIVDSLRLQLRQQGNNGFLGLARNLRIMDSHNCGTLAFAHKCGTLAFAEFYKAIKECQLPAGLTKKSVEHLFRFFDSNDTGLINCDEFMIGIRGILNTTRMDLVLLVFDKLNADKSGLVNLVSISRHADVIIGSKVKSEALSEFLAYFEGCRGVKNGCITLNDFESYYSNLSASIDDDDYFESMIRKTWQIRDVE